MKKKKKPLNYLLLNALEYDLYYIGRKKNRPAQWVHL